MRRVESRLRVRYAESDQMGVVYYANYFVWMEIGRVDYCSQLGFEYRDMEAADGIFLVVTDARCRYRRAARFHDPIRVVTWVSESRSRTIRFSYEIRHAEDDRLLATGETLHTVCDRDGKTVRLPEKYRPFFPLTSTA
ncbi:MAG: thioesterase family protein [Bryobacterales bacterium]|nr:thioesterase family protein [Bryobacterales bacterium]MDE0293770.1 thioesterase family protein [Bryobacterales bacterium]